MVKEYKLRRVKTIRVTMSMVKDFDQHISVSLSISRSVSLSDSLRRISMKLRVVNPAECYSCGWTNHFIITYLSISLRCIKFMNYLKSYNEI